MPADEYVFDGPAFEEDEAPMQNGQQPRGDRRGPYQHKENKGSMFENGHKTSDKHPDFTGSVNVNGTIYWLSAWKNMTHDGKKWLSVAVKLQEERPQEQRPSQAPRRQNSGW
jgi:hypothetical protein